MGKKKYTQKNVFMIPTYRNIIHLISWSENNYKEITRKHLKIALCVKHGLDISKKQEDTLKDFFNISEEKLSEMYSNKIKHHKDFKFYTKNELKKLESSRWLINNKEKEVFKNTFKNDNVLNDVLDRLKNDLKLIDTKKSKKGYNHYVLTKKGNVEYARHRLLRDIERLPDNEILFFKLQDLFKLFIKEYKE